MSVLFVAWSLRSSCCLMHAFKKKKKKKGSVEGVESKVPEKFLRPPPVPRWLSSSAWMCRKRLHVHLFCPLFSLQTVYDQHFITLYNSQRYTSSQSWLWGSSIRYEGVGCLSVLGRGALLQGCHPIVVGMWLLCSLAWSLARQFHELGS